MSSKPSGPDCRDRVWYFGNCKFDECRYELRIAGQVVGLEAKPMLLLHHLLIHAGEVVRKEELLEVVWPGVLVVDASLATAVSKLRKALGEEEGIIKTVPKVGYRLAVPVRCELPTEGAQGSASEAPPQSFAHVHPVPPGVQFNHFALRIGIAVVLVVCTVVGLASFRSTPRPAAGSKGVAILPFQNLGSDHATDYLSFAVTDEIANTLSDARGVELRPLAETRAYTSSSLDVREVARNLNVNRLVTGNYLVAGDRLLITMEALDADQNRVLWHDTVNVPASNLLSLQAQVAAMSRKNLAGALGVTEFAADSVPPPRNEEAYELYLRSTAMAWDPEPNKVALGLLRKSVDLDPSYAPAWGILSLRYYSYSRFGGGGPEMLQLSDAAAERQLALDPNSPDPVGELTVTRTERGELVKAHQDATELVRRRPDNASNHHVLSYVLRYGGSIDEAAHECDLTELLASRFVWGSCSTSWMEAGDYAKARKFLRTDLGSEWSKAHGIEVYLRWGHTDDALRVPAPKIAAWNSSYQMVLACAAHAPPPTITSLATAVKPDDDPEVNYFFAGHLAYCGKTQPALNMLSLAIKSNYCSYPTMDRDPMFDRIRNTPGFAKVRSEAIACHQAFIDHHLPNPGTPIVLAQNP